jgi:hypothetical protein
LKDSLPVHVCRPHTAGIKLMQDAKQLSPQINFALTKASRFQANPLADKSSTDKA